MLYFQVEVGYFYKKTNKNKYKNLQLIASKEQLKDSCRADCTGRLLATATCHTLLLVKKITKSAKCIFQVQFMFLWARCKSLYIYINTIEINKNHHCCWWHNAGPQGFLLLSLRGITFVWAHCSQPKNKTNLYEHI